MPPMPIDNASKLMSHLVQHYARSIEQNSAIEQRDDADSDDAEQRRRVLPRNAALGGAPLQGGSMPDTWRALKQWPELVLERLDDAGVSRIVLNRPQKRNCLNGPLVAAFFESLEIVRGDPELKVVITKGAGPAYSSGLDLAFLRSVSVGRLRDWDRPTPTIQLAQTLRDFPRVTIAQVHGYCLGGALGIMNMHDLVFAAEDAQLGMPEVLRGSFGQLVTSTLLHGRIPIKKLALIQLVGRNISGTEADRIGIVSQSVPAAELESTVTGIGREIASRHLSPLQHAKIAVQLGRDLSLSQALQIDQLVGARQRLLIDPTGDIENYLQSQKGGPNLDYRRPDV
jgi:enoyl-CoA hydratase/carnithine racemase